MKERPLGVEGFFPEHRREAGPEGLVVSELDAQRGRRANEPPFAAATAIGRTLSADPVGRLRHEKHKARRGAIRRAL
jgi:hypothetical protein